MHEEYLVAPGPTPVPESARLAMAKSIIHHRGPAFTQIMREVSAGLQWVFQTEHPVLALSCSGTGAFESAVVNFTKRGDTAICIGGGKFGERWSGVCAAYGLNVVDVPVDWGKAVDLDAFTEVLKSNPAASIVTFCASETSTGVMHPVEELIARTRQHAPDALTFVDGITAVGVHDLPMDALGIDVLVSGSQKAFGVPPGLGFVGVGPRAVARIEDSDHPRYYFDLRKELKSQAKGQTAFTSSISPTLALHVTLQMMQDEGLPAVFARHTRLAEATRAGVLALGLEIFAETPANSVTAVRLPDSISAPDVVKAMREMGVIIAGGQDSLKPFLIRIGHLGFYDNPDILLALSALERALQKFGYQLEPGASLAAAQSVFSNSEY